MNRRHHNPRPGDGALGREFEEAVGRGGSLQLGDRTASKDRRRGLQARRGHIASSMEC
jgi:hypothetical protein